MQEEGTVVESHGDRAKIRVERGSACRHCSAKALCRPFGETISLLEVANPVGAAQGQRVVVAIEPARLVKNSVFLYGMPAAALVVGAISGSYLAGALFEKDRADAFAIIGAVVLLGLALVVTRVLERAAARKQESLPRIVAIVDE